MKRVCQNLLVPALDAGLQKDRPYQSDFIGPVLMRSREGRGAREQDSFDPSLWGGCLVWHTVEPLFSD